MKSKYSLINKCFVSYLVLVHLLLNKKPRRTSFKDSNSLIICLDRISTFHFNSYLYIHLLFPPCNLFIIFFSFLIISCLFLLLYSHSNNVFINKAPLKLSAFKNLSKCSLLTDEFIWILADNNRDKIQENLEECWERYNDISTRLRLLSTRDGRFNRKTDFFFRFHL